VAEDAARALGRMGPAARDAVPTLVATVRLSALDLETRRWAVRALGAIGRGAGRATPALVEALDGPLAHDAAFALMAVAPDTARATPAAVEIFRRALHDQSLDVQRAAVMALGISGPVARDALPDLRALITEHPDGKLRDLASRAITLIESR
jgi:HEAT repeat protein